MKKLVGFLLSSILLAGCAAEDVFETVADEFVQSAAAPAAEIILSLPEDAAAPVSQSEAGTLYQCGGYELLVQTAAAGDLDATLRAVTGYGREELTVMETRSGTIKRYDLVWACMGENGQQVGRACILDDGNYHYALSVLADDNRVREFESAWEDLFSSYSLG